MERKGGDEGQMERQTEMKIAWRGRALMIDAWKGSVEMKDAWRGIAEMN